MVTMGVLCFVISGAFILTLMIKNCVNTLHIKGMLYAVLLTGPAAMLAIEFGWF